MTSEVCFFSLGGIQVREDSISKEDSFKGMLGMYPCVMNIYIYMFTDICRLQTTQFVGQACGNNSGFREPHLGLLLK